MARAGEEPDEEVSLGTRSYHTRRITLLGLVVAVLSCRSRSRAREDTTENDGIRTDREGHE